MCTGDSEKPLLSPAFPYTHILGALRLQERMARLGVCSHKPAENAASSHKCCFHDEGHPVR